MLQQITKSAHRQLYKHINVMFTKYEAAQLFSTLKIMFLEQRIIKIISEGSCDTEDWINNAKIQLWSQKYIAFKNVIK